MSPNPAALDDLLATILVENRLVESSRIDEWRREKSGSRLTDFLLARGYLTPAALHRSMTVVAERAKAARADARVEGETIGRFVKRDLLGAGGFGEVWRARDPVLDRDVALKVLQRIDAVEIEGLLQEARAAARLRHPHIVAIHEVGKDASGTPFIVMDFIDGAALSKLTLPVRRVLELVRDAARALSAAHEQGLVHRDIKPENLLVDAQGRVYVADFGLAQAQEGIVGTPRWMSPEAAKGGRVDARADVYGLGAILYWGLTGKPPGEGKTVDEVLKSVQRGPPRPRGNPDVEAIVLKAIEKDASRRYATAADLADDIERYLRGDPVVARRATLVYRIGKRIRKSPMLYAAATPAVGGIVAGRYAGARSALAKARGFEAGGRLEPALEAYSRSGSQWETAEARRQLERAAPEYSGTGRRKKTEDVRPDPSPAGERRQPILPRPAHPPTHWTRPPARASISPAMTRRIEVGVDVPADLDSQLVEKVRSLVQEAIALELYRWGAVTSGAGADLLRIARHEFLDLASRRGVPTLQTTEEHLGQELETLRRAAGGR